jgi:hypothetical protein
VVAVGNAVESMRRRASATSRPWRRQSGKLARLEEADRIARDLEQTADRDIYAIGLALQSVTGPVPGQARAAARRLGGEATVDETGGRIAVDGRIPIEPGAGH